MNQFYIKATVYIKVFGISSESKDVISVFTKAPNRETAKRKFEEHCRQRFAHMGFDSMRFEYIEIAYEI
jgi:hypothetical protein